ncbi:hypothetical protein [Actinomadura oligospora]|uniref:hypothetical protein n=1 Tax=Actinomadura oligospora TaxID=111804 RepID=UPI0004BC14F3|nr:hypothetical protein [Actinomadura oligospora]
MGLRARLLRFAARRPRPLVVAVPGFTAVRLAVEADLRRRGWRPALTPAEADLLIVCGRPGPDLADAVDTVWDQMPNPRARADLHSPSDVLTALDAASAHLADEPAQVTDAASRASFTPESSMDHSAMGHGDMGQGHEGHAAMGDEHAGHEGMDHEAMGQAHMNHDAENADEDHEGHEGHSGHEGHAASGGHEGHQGHEGHAAMGDEHAGHEAMDHEAMGHAHMNHDAENADEDHEGHQGHEGHGGHAAMESGPSGREAMDHAAMGHGGHEGHGGGHGGGHEHHMMGVPHGLAMADRAPDRDGLKLDVLHVPFGPVLADWPAGLKVTFTLQGDVVQAAEVENLSADADADAEHFWDETNVVAARLDALARLLAVAGWTAQAAQARVLRDEALTNGRVEPSRLAKFVRRTRRSRTLRWMLQDVAIGETNAWTRVSDQLAELGGETRRHTSAPPLDELLVGLDVAAARLLIAALDPETVRTVAEHV